MPAAVMVLQDGAGQVDEKGRWKTNVVFDNLIHKQEMPVTIGVFINPGVLEAKDQPHSRTATTGASNVVLAGPDLDWLYATAGDKVFRRKLRRTGVVSWKPVKPPQPRL